MARIGPESSVLVLWVVWFVSWMAAAFWRARTVSRPGARREVAYRVIVIAGAILLFGSFEDRHLFDMGAFAWVMVGIVAGGQAFTWWARIHLGRLWSGRVTQKADHRVIDSGPYALVRHPIYAGLILAAGATAVLRGRLSAFAGAALITLGSYIKARLEERFLREQLGKEEYDAYARRVPMLVPFTRG